MSEKKFNHKAKQHSNSLFYFIISELLNYLDPKIDPCEDFYNYACGGWIKNNPLPNEKAMWNQFSKLEEESNKFIWHVLHSKDIQVEYSKVRMQGNIHFVVFQSLCAVTL